MRGLRFILPLIAVILFTVIINAKEVEALSNVTLSPSNSYMTDRKDSTYASLSSFSASSEKEIHSVYIIFDKPAGQFDIKNDYGESASVNENDFLHLFLQISDLFGSAQKSLIFDFGGNDVRIADIYFFSEGETPAWVQKWEKEHEKAELLLMSAHSDDEHLFFAGIVPLYAAEKGLAVQIVYVTHNWDTYNRPHELLNGLWTVGMKNYPVIGHFPDLYSTSLSGAQSAYSSKGYTEEDFTSFQVEMIRRFKPLVVVSHDINGEYGHGTHILTARALQNAIISSLDCEQFPDSEVKYGIWQPYKVYLHLWKENRVELDLDSPLDYFGGRSAFEMAKEGYACHHSQQWTWFTKWINANKASDIKAYSPREYGLYFTSVGEDTNKDGFFENITLFAEQKEREQAEKELYLTAEEQKDEQKTESGEGIDLPAEKPYLNDKTDKTEKKTENGKKIIILIISAALLAVIASVCVCVCAFHIKKHKKAASRIRKNAAHEPIPKRKN